MFKEQYLLELLSGKLSEKGYSSILGSISAMVRHNQWQKSIIVSGDTNKDWTSEDIKELAHMFFEWIIVNEKLRYLNKVPYEYLSYYFTQMLVSFVANRIKEEQQKVGISFQKCQELIKAICEEEYTIDVIGGKNYIKSQDSTSDRVIEDIEDVIKYMAHIPIDGMTHQYKPIVKIIADDILLNADGYISVENLSKAAFSLLDQTQLFHEEESFTAPAEFEETGKYDNVITEILSGVNKIEASIYLDYIFQENGQVSLADLASKYEMPKSTIHKKIEDFKKKIFSTYIPENEEDGISFLQKLAGSLDEISK